MSNDPIKAALDAAKVAAMDAVVALENVWQDGQAPTDAWLNAVAPAAVAAFLRALPVAEGQAFHHVLLSSRVVELLAGAVERTAQEK